MCGEGMDVFALGIQNRGVTSVIAPNGFAPDGQTGRLDCEQCGMCIDVCPVGALTSGSYRYKTRPWEMNHVSTVCTHCADGCKVTLGVRQSNDGSQIIRADNRDKSGLNGDFLCAKGRFGFDFVESPERLTTPLVRNAKGKLEPATWEQALRFAGKKLKEIRDTRGGEAIGVIGSNRTTNEENYLLQKFARTILKTNNIDHKRTARYAEFASALAGHHGKTAGLQDIAHACAILLVGGDPTEEHPLLAWTLRTNVRLNRAHLYLANSKSIKLERQAKATQGLPPGGYKDLVALLELGTTDFSKAIMAEESLVIVFGEECRGQAMADMIAWGLKRGNVRFALLGDHSNSRGAADMGLSPDLLPGYVPVTAPAGFAEYAGLLSAPGKTLTEMVAATDSGELGALLVVGANPLPKLAAKTERLERPQGWPMWCCRRRASTKNPARSPIPTAMCNW
jgi:NADH-quinone oxidoreductase subunit G